MQQAPTIAVADRKRPARPNLAVRLREAQTAYVAALRAKEPEGRLRELFDRWADLRDQAEARGY